MNAIVDRWISDHKDEIVKALQESVRIPSVEGTAEAGAPFGANVKRALDHALELGKGFGFETRDMDGYIGLIDHGEGEETLGIMCHLDVVPEGEGWDHPPYGLSLIHIFFRGPCFQGGFRGTLNPRRAVRARKGDSFIRYGRA